MAASSRSRASAPSNSSGSATTWCAAGDRPKIAVVHVAAFCNVGQISGDPKHLAMDGSMVIWDTKELRKVLERHNVKLVLQGHSHRVEDTFWNGTWYVTSPAAERRLVGRQLDRLRPGLLDHPLRRRQGHLVARKLSLGSRTSTRKTRSSARRSPTNRPIAPNNNGDANLNARAASNRSMGSPRWSVGLRIRRLEVRHTGRTHAQQMHFDILCVWVVEMQDSAVGPRVDPARGG